MVSPSSHAGDPPPRQLFTGARLFDGAAWREGMALLVEAGRIAGIVPTGSTIPDAEVVRLDGGILAPGLVDLQVNGGGGVQFNEAPTTDSIAAICAAHGRAGTTSVVVTLISSDDATRRRAMTAAAEAWRRRIPGFAGLHLEGPHITRAGAHDARHLRTLTDHDVDDYLAARTDLPALIVTLAPESAVPAQIARLAASGVVVSLGHSSCTYEQAIAAAEAGASLVTHLFNAMGALTARDPGLAGAALASPRLTPGLIADGVHVARAVAAIALRARKGLGGLFLVSDAMAPAGTDLDVSRLDGVALRRDGGVMRRPDGALAGSVSVLLDGVRWLARLVEAGGSPQVGEPDGLLHLALAAASATPALLIGTPAGRLAVGAQADLVHLADNLSLRGVWRSGAADGLNRGAPFEPHASAP